MDCFGCLLDSSGVGTGIPTTTPPHGAAGGTNKWAPCYERHGSLQCRPFEFSWLHRDVVDGNHAAHTSVVPLLFVKGDVSCATSAVPKIGRNGAELTTPMRCTGPAVRMPVPTLVVLAKEVPRAVPTICRSSMRICSCMFSDTSTSTRCSALCNCRSPGQQELKSVITPHEPGDELESSNIVYASTNLDL